MKVPNTYLWPAVVLLLTVLSLGLAFHLLVPDFGTELWINDHHLPVLDIFFKYYTHVGDGLILLPLGILLLATHTPLLRLALWAFGIKTIVIQLSKNWIFKGTPRPKTYFESKGLVLQYVEGVQVHGFDSFPSGHTATAFAWLGVLLLYIGYLQIGQRSKKVWGLALCLLAVLVGISRIYLVQHFVVDTLAGALVGLASVLIARAIVKIPADHAVGIARLKAFYSQYRQEIWVSVLASLLFLPGLGMVHLFDWDEINFAESAREMLLTGEYWRVQINYQPFWEKPPLFIWLQSLCMSVFGVSEYAARLPNAVTGVVASLFIYQIAQKMEGSRYAWYAVLCYVGAFLPHFYFKSGIIDPVFNVLIVGSLWMWGGLSPTETTYKRAILAGILLGMAVLTKGFVAWLLVGMVTGSMLLLSAQERKALWLKWMVFVLTSMIVASVWYLQETLRHGSWFVTEFLEYHIRLFTTEDCGHGQPWYYHPVVLYLGCFPTSILFVYYFKKFNFFTQHRFIQMLTLLFFTVLIVFSISQTKIVHYSSLCYYPIAFLGAYTLLRYFKTHSRLGLGVKLQWSVLGILLGGGIVALGSVEKWKQYLIPYIKDTFAVANIQQSVHWMGWEWAVGVFLMLAVVAAFWVDSVRGAASAAVVLLTGSLVTLQVAMYLIVPKVEKYVQGTLIEMYSQFRDQDCYVKAVGFKSYGQYFYTARRSGYPTSAEDDHWLMEGAVDKPAYIVTKVDRNHYKDHPNLELMLDKGGFVLYKRK